MKKAFPHKALYPGLLYYVLLPLLFLLGIFVAGLLMDLLPDDLGTIMVASLFTIFVGFPVMSAVFMRFSLLPWVVDPFAALEMPLTVYGILLYSQFTRQETFDLSRAILRAHTSLMDDGGSGYWFLALFFLFSLLMTLSVRRPKHRSLAYRLLRLTPDTDC